MPTDAAPQRMLWYDLSVSECVLVRENEEWYTSGMLYHLNIKPKSDSSAQYILYSHSCLDTDSSLTHIIAHREKNASMMANFPTQSGHSTNEPSSVHTRIRCGSRLLRQQFSEIRIRHTIPLLSLCLRRLFCKLRGSARECRMFSAVPDTQFWTGRANEQPNGKNTTKRD